jgi:hypothetical protein
VGIVTALARGASASFRLVLDRSATSAETDRRTLVRVSQAPAVLGLILADEVEHGRAGWAYLSSVRDDGPVMEAVQRKLGHIVQTVSTCWYDDTPITLPGGAPEHGLLSNEDTHRCVKTALREIILPGFARLGLVTSDAEHILETLAGWRARSRLGPK